jgi:hypothetical protein
MMGKKRERVEVCVYQINATYDAPSWNFKLLHLDILKLEEMEGSTGD